MRVLDIEVELYSLCDQLDSFLLLIKKSLLANSCNFPRLISIKILKLNIVGSYRTPSSEFNDLSVDNREFFRGIVAYILTMNLKVRG